MNLLCRLGIHNYKERKLSGLLCTRCRRFRNYNHFDMAKYIDLPKGGLDEIAEKTVSEMIEAGLIFRIPVFYKHKEEWFNMGMPKGEKLVQIVKEWTDKEGNQ